MSNVTPIDSAELSNVSGGGLIGNAWKLAKGGAHVAKDAYHGAKHVYHDVKPIASKIAPFAIAGSQIHNIVKRAKHDF